MDINYDHNSDSKNCKGTAGHKSSSNGQCYKSITRAGKGNGLVLKMKAVMMKNVLPNDPLRCKNLIYFNKNFVISDAY